MLKFSLAVSTGGVAGAVSVADKADKTDATARIDNLVPSSRFAGLQTGDLNNVALPETPVGQFRLFLDGPKPADVWVAVTWGA